LSVASKRRAHACARYNGAPRAEYGPRGAAVELLGYIYVVKEHTQLVDPPAFFVFFV